jgi:hypothetical protein
MSIQTIVNNASSITIDRHKTSGQTISRSGIVRTAELASNIPWFFTIEMHNGLAYSTNRAITEEIDRLDRTIEEEINIGLTNTGLAYITRYQGDATLTSATINSVSGSNIYLNCSSIGAGSGYLFKKGDYIQPSSSYRYPYTVTADVAYTTSSNVTIPVNRPVISQTGYTFAGKSIKVGSNVTWRVKMFKKPTYTIVPYDRIQWDSEFQLVEIITDS